MNFLLTEGMGWIEVVTGSMFSGKSEELIRRLRRANYASQKIVAFKHSIDNRYDESKISSHSKNFIKAIPVSNIENMKKIYTEKYNDSQVIGIDEAQFFGEEIVKFCESLANLGKRVIVAGLDQDFRGEPFKPIDELLARAEYIDKFNAICMVCGNPASKTQRLVNGEPARYDDPIVLVGAEESYEARCRKCHVIKPSKNITRKLYFIVGTGTDVGKTYTTLKLAKEDIEKGKNISILKPVETGKELFRKDLKGSDSYKYSKLLEKSVEKVNLYFYQKAMAPNVAAKLENANLSISKIKNEINRHKKNYETVYIEGAGGLLVPIKNNYTYLDLLADYRKESEAILIINNELGAINHAMLTIDVLKRNDIQIKGLIFNNRNNVKNEILLENNITTILEMSNLPLIAKYGYKSE